MRVINAANVHRALPMGMGYLINSGIRQDSRNGPVIVAPVPVTTVYERPRERVLFWAARDANPFFHFMEGLWMLAGRNDIAYLTRYNQRMKDYSDDEQTQHGAYGFRWKKHFGNTLLGDFREPVGTESIDQLSIIIERLKTGRHDRRCVLTMWDPEEDLGKSGRDFPCNTHAYFSASQGVLDMTVCCRSNDIIWGAYGANAVHFSMMQEYMASMIGIPVGKYWQISNNYHAYESVFNPLVEGMSVLDNSLVDMDPYDARLVEPYPMVSTEKEIWDQDLNTFMIGHTNPTHYFDPFFSQVALVIQNAHKAYKAKCYEDAIKILLECKALDWAYACTQWVYRRQISFKAATNDGVNYDAS